MGNWEIWRKAVVVEEVVDKEEGRKPKFLIMYNTPNANENELFTFNVALHQTRYYYMWGQREGTQPELLQFTQLCYNTSSHNNAGKYRAATCN